MKLLKTLLLAGLAATSYADRTQVQVMAGAGAPTDYPECSSYEFKQKVLPRLRLEPTNATFIGYEDVKEEIRGLVVKPAMFPDDYKGLLGSSRGLLVYGPPGTGKTFIFQTMSNELYKYDKEIWKVQYADLWKTAYVGEGGQRLKCLLERANEAGNVLILFDEGELIFGARGSSTNDKHREEVITVALNMIGNESKFMSLVITNMPEQIDFAIRRRVGNQFCFRLPTAEERLQVLKTNFAADGWELSDTKFDEAYFKKHTDMFSNDDILNLAQKMARFKAEKTEMRPIRDWAVPFSTEDLKEALVGLKPTLNVDDLIKYAEYSLKYSNPCFTEFLAAGKYTMGNGEKISIAEDGAVTYL